MESSVSGEKHFVFHWKIKNLGCTLLPNGEWFSSPSFTLFTFGASEWELHLFQRRKPVHTPRYISCDLYRRSDACPYPLHIKWDVKASASNEHFKGFNSSFDKNNREFIFKLLPDRDLEPTDSLIIVCKLTCVLPTSQPGTGIPPNLSSSGSIFSSCYGGKKILGKRVHSHPTTSEQNAEKISGECEKKNRLYVCPWRCFAQTLFVIKKSSAKRPVHNSIIDQIGTKQTIHITPLNQIPPLLITIKSAVTLSLWGFERALTVQICLKNGTSAKSVLVIFQLGVLVRGKIVMQLLPEEHLFRANQKDDIWTLKETINLPTLISILKESLNKESIFNEASWKLEFTVADGETRSEVLWEETAGDYDCLYPYDVPVLSSQMLPSYKDDKFCDGTLMVGCTAYKVHRAVLAAMSPVFSAMFDRDIAEGVTSTVDMGDFECAIVENLCSFIYRGRLKTSSTFNIYHLYTAAHRYEIVPLVNLCRKLLIDRIHFGTVCKTLRFAHEHKDLNLKEAAIKFIYFCKGIVLKSEEWKQFKKENLTLAFEILEQVCCKCRKSSV